MLVVLSAGSGNSNSLIRRASKGQWHVILRLTSQQENGFWPKELTCTRALITNEMQLFALFLKYKVRLQLTRRLCCMQLGLRVLYE